MDGNGHGHVRNRLTVGGEGRGTFGAPGGQQGNGEGHKGTAEGQKKWL